MKPIRIVKPEVELWKQGDDITKHIARCARLCYASTGDQDQALVNSLRKRSHNSMFRHWGMYYKIPIIEFRNIYHLVQPYVESAYINVLTKTDYCYISFNKNFYLDHSNKAFIHVIIPYQVDVDTFMNDEKACELVYHTFFVRCSISTSRELNRVSPNAIAERSTRYVNYSKQGLVTICAPYWLHIDNEVYYKHQDHEHYLSVDNTNWHPWANAPWEHSITSEKIQPITQAYFCSWFNAATDYLWLIEQGEVPQDAREVLDLITVTECAYTYTTKQWRDILDLRYYGITGKPHPNAKFVAHIIKNNLEELGYKFR